MIQTTFGWFFFAFHLTMLKVSVTVGLFLFPTEQQS